MVLHSGFFESMYATPSSDDMEGTSDESPLMLPTGLCSAQAFTMICKFLYQVVVGLLPTVTVKELDLWEPVLDATSALELLGTQNCIVKMLCADKKHFLSSTSRLLNLANRINHEELKWCCYYEFFHRIQPLSFSECAVLGASDLSVITRIRELVRGEIWTLTRTDMVTGKLCKDPRGCSELILSLVRKQIGKCNQIAAKGSIFETSESTSLCSHCDPRGSDWAGVCRVKKLDEKVHKWVSDTESLRFDGDNGQ
ncbi:hypothetical protein BDV93DRAFT_563667 [Ceratobasidium sp. AG-I]|nr:hypothetical protein BDV93DRAFT_563667 [Ceratobasidium sp. AG-I]